MRQHHHTNTSFTAFTVAPGHARGRPTRTPAIDAARLYIDPAAPDASCDLCGRDTGQVARVVYPRNSESSETSAPRDDRRLNVCALCAHRWSRVAQTQQSSQYRPMPFIEAHGRRDWCHLCGLRGERLAAVRFGPERQRYLRACSACTGKIAQIAASRRTTTPSARSVEPLPFRLLLATEV